MSSQHQERRVGILYLDIDGTVRHGKEQLGRFVNSPEDVVVFPEAVRQMKRWREAGGRIIGVSNQGGIALGLVDPAQVEKAMQRTHILCDAGRGMASAGAVSVDASEPS